MPDVTSPSTQAAPPPRPDPRRGLFYAAGGALADVIVLLFNKGFTASSSLLGPWLIPVSLLIGAGVGLVCWLGVELGHARWLRAEWTRAGMGRPSGLIALGTIALSVALGVAAVLQPTSAAALITALILTSSAAIALFHGYFTGMRAEPGLAIGTLMALVFGMLGGVLFGLGAGVTYAATYQPPNCTEGCTIVVGPVLGAVILVIYGGVVGLGLGFGMSVASACGLLMRPFTRHVPERQE
jgi:hypothetical protein